jgi:hypothetical protein
MADGWCKTGETMHADKTYSDNASRVSRRDFMKGAAAAALTTVFAPVLLGVSDKSGRRNPILGSGEHTYEVLHDWGELPDHIHWGDTHGVCIDDAGFIYMTHSSPASEPMDAIVIFDPEGKYVRTFGKAYHGGGHGLDIRKEGREEFLYFSDIKNRQVVKLTLNGEEVWRLSYPQEAGVYENLEQFRPTNVAFAPDGGFYVADGYGSHYIHQYDKDARWIRTWGGFGGEPGKLKIPHSIWLDDRPGRTPALAVADRANARLQYFTLEGEHISFVEGLPHPADFDIRGVDLLAPDLHARITILDKNNNVIAHLGYDPEWTENVLKNQLRQKTESWRPGRFVHPHDACFDKDGNIFVMEWVPVGRVTRLQRVG